MVALCQFLSVECSREFIILSQDCWQSSLDTQNLYFWFPGLHLWCSVVSGHEDQDRWVLTVLCWASQCPRQRKIACPHIRIFTLHLVAKVFQVIKGIGNVCLFLLKQKVKTYNEFCFSYKWDTFKQCCILKPLLYIFFFTSTHYCYVRKCKLLKICKTIHRATLCLPQALSWLGR